MKFMIIISRSMSLLAALAIFGMASPAWAAPPDGRASAEKVKAEAEDLMQALEGYTVAQKEEAVRKTGAALDALDDRIGMLENRVDSKWDSMSEAARNKARATLAALREERTEVAEWYGGLKNSSADAWGHVKQGFSEAYSALQQSWDKAEKEFAESST